MRRYLTIQEMKSIMHRVIRHSNNKIKIRLRPTMKHSGMGEYSPDTDTIVINTAFKLTKSKFISILCHEYAHFYCTKNNKHKYYHKNRMISRKNAVKMASAGWRAERYVDYMAQKFVSQIFPDEKVTFHYCYVDNADKRWLFRYYMEDYYSPQEIREYFKKKNFYDKKPGTYLDNKNGAVCAVEVRGRHLKI